MFKAKSTLDVAAWPRLVVRRDKIESRRAYIHHLRSWLPTLWLTWTSLPFIVVIIVVCELEQTQVTRRAKIIISTLWAAPLLLSYLVCITFRTLLDYELLLSHMDAAVPDLSRYQKLKRALPSPIAQLLPFRERIVILLLHAILLPWAPFEWCVTGLRWICGASKLAFISVKDKIWNTSSRRVLQEVVGLA